MGRSHVSSARKSLQRKQRVGLSRLWRYLEGRHGRVALLSLIAVTGAAAPVVGLMIVQDAIDNGMKAHDVSRLSWDVAIYLCVNAAAWVLQTTLIRGLADI